MDLSNAMKTARALQEAMRRDSPPPEEGAPSADEAVVYMSLLRNIRNYLERIAHQVNGAYAGGWYDASAVMIRRLVETLIIELYEARGLAANIKNRDGDFFYLRDLIAAVLAEPSWGLSRNAKNALPMLKDIGDQSAHSRRFTAQRQDIDNLMPALRTVVQELVEMADPKKKRVDQ